MCVRVCVCVCVGIHVRALAGEMTASDDAGASKGRSEVMKGKMPRMVATGLCTRNTMASTVDLRNVCVRARVCVCVCACVRTWVCTFN